MKTLTLYFFTETHLDYLIPNVNIKCVGFETPIRKDRNSSGGSIILYYKNYVNISRRLDLQLEHSQVESMRFELKTKLSPILININHRPVKNGLCLIKDETGHKSHDLGNTQPAS